ncbi:hypothetical protein KC350_g37 [Hortaea werneckii]|nr:hypothetical protein KC350_g37 [Hortaea werneckii]
MCISCGGLVSVRHPSIRGAATNGGSSSPSHIRLRHGETGIFVRMVCRIIVTIIALCCFAASSSISSVSAAPVLPLRPRHSSSSFLLKTLSGSSGKPDAVPAEMSFLRLE